MCISPSKVYFEEIFSCSWNLLLLFVIISSVSNTVLPVLIISINFIKFLKDLFIFVYFWTIWHGAYHCARTAGYFIWGQEKKTVIGDLLSNSAVTTSKNILKDPPVFIIGTSIYYKNLFLRSEPGENWLRCKVCSLQAHA